VAGKKALFPFQNKGKRMSTYPTAKTAMYEEAAAKRTSFPQIQQPPSPFQVQCMQVAKSEAVYTFMSSLIEGENMEREGLAETPARVAKAWKHWTSGYDIDIGKLLKTFEDGAEGCDQMVVRKNIPIYSKCEHHLADIFGTCTIAYIPNGRVLGLSKMDRLADAFARRLQVQERLTNQIADAMMEHLSPKGVGVFLNCRHMCVESRGVQNQDSATITSALRGLFLTDAMVRSEFLALARA